MSVKGYSLNREVNVLNWTTEFFSWSLINMLEFLGSKSNDVGSDKIDFSKVFDTVRFGYSVIVLVCISSLPILPIDSVNQM
jgi:hypothetical protein